MKLSEIASVSGKGGLFRIVGSTRSGLILESLDESKTKLVATSSHRTSILHEISIFTTTREGSVPLGDVLKKIHQTYGSDLGVDQESDASELKAFLKSVLPEFDENRVYTSDMKKLIRWYGLILKFAPDVLTDQADTAAPTA